MVTKKIKPAAPASRRGLFELVNDDARIIEEEIDKLQAQGMSYEDAVEKAVMAVDALTDEKALAYGGLILELEAQAKAIEVKVKMQQARVISKQNQADRLRVRMIELLPKEFKAENENISVKFAATPAKLIDSMVMDVEALPEALRRVVPETYQIKKDEVKAELQRINDLIMAAPENERKALALDLMKDMQGMRLETGWRVVIK